MNNHNFISEILTYFYNNCCIKNEIKCTKVLNLAAVPSVNLYYRVHVTCTFKIGQVWSNY